MDTYGINDEYTNLSHQPKRNYCILKQEEIVQLQEDDITKVSTVLSIPKADACCLLLHFNWNFSRLEDQWFEDEDKVRRKVGLLKEPLVQFKAEYTITCGLCSRDFLYDEFRGSTGTVFSAACGHPFCRDCWFGYIGKSINEDGPGCLKLMCPEPSCEAGVGPDLVSAMTSKEDNERYKHYLLRSYVEGSRTIKWCPAPNCEYAVEFNADGTERNYDVLCLCSNRFCWKCTEESHRPVDCVMVNKWILKNKNMLEDSRTTLWILENTRPCPNCKTPTEKKPGGHRMNCTCRYKFCWYCLERWERWHVCNSHWSMEDTKMLRKKLERYLDYHQQWTISNQYLKQQAIEELQNLQTVHLKEQFITEAWEQIIECRRVLGWTYVYRYYMSEDNLKSKLFEHKQGLAESNLERLHKCAKTELNEFALAKEERMEGFNAFRIKLTNFTKSTAKYYEELVTELENDLGAQLNFDEKIGTSHVNGEMFINKYVQGYESKASSSKKRNNGSEEEKSHQNVKLVNEIRKYLHKGASAGQLKSLLGTLSGTPQEIMDALFEALFEGVGKEFTKEVGKVKNYLAAATQAKGSDQMVLLQAIESFSGNASPDAAKEVVLVLKLLYDVDVLEEEFILKWYEQGMAGKNKNSPIWNNVKPLIEWLQTAEYESEEE